MAFWRLSSCLSRLSSLPLCCSSLCNSSSCLSRLSSLCLCCSSLCNSSSCLSRLFSLSFCCSSLCNSSLSLRSMVLSISNSSSLFLNLFNSSSLRVSGRISSSVLCWTWGGFSIGACLRNSSYLLNCSSSNSGWGSGWLAGRSVVGLVLGPPGHWGLVSGAPEGL